MRLSISCLGIIWYKSVPSVSRNGMARSVGAPASTNSSYHRIRFVHPRWTQVLVHLSKLRKFNSFITKPSNSHSRHTPGRLGSREFGPMDFHGIRPQRFLFHRSNTFQGAMCHPSIFKHPRPMRPKADAHPPHLRPWNRLIHLPPFAQHSSAIHPDPSLSLIHI